MRLIYPEKFQLNKGFLEIGIDYNFHAGGNVIKGVDGKFGATVLVEHKPEWKIHHSLELLGKL